MSQAMFSRLNFSYTVLLTFVLQQIIHTNMGNIVKSVAGKYGSQMQTGHADFYRKLSLSFSEISRQVL